jgi:hypothetical protein
MVRYNRSVHSMCLAHLHRTVGVLGRIVAENGAIDTFGRRRQPRAWTVVTWREKNEQALQYMAQAQEHDFVAPWCGPLGTGKCQKYCKTC